MSGLDAHFAVSRLLKHELAQITVELDEGTYIDPCQMTLAAWLEIWMSEYMGDKKWSTVKSYKAQVKTHILRILSSANSEVSALVERFTKPVFLWMS